MPARIVYLSEFPTILGGEQALGVLLAGLNRQQYEPVVLGTGGGLFEQLVRNTNAEFVPLPTDWRQGSSAERAALLRDLTLPLKPKLVHANSLIFSTHLGGVTQELGVPCVGHVRDIMKLSNARVGRLNLLDELLVASEATRENLLAHGVEADRARVVYDGIDAQQQWNPAVIQPGTLRRELGLAAESPIIGLSGQLSLRKDQAMFLRAFTRIAQRFPTAHAVLLGERYTDHPDVLAMEDECRALAATCSGRVHLMGYRQDAPLLMRDFTMLASAARQEPCGRTMLEAMALGCPVVATDVGGTCELLGQNACGLLVEAWDDADMANALAQLLDDPELGKTLGTTGRRRALERFSVKQYVADVECSYARLM